MSVMLCLADILKQVSPGEGIHRFALLDFIHSLMSGRVYLVGSGPGDPGLLTLKGMNCIRRADVIVYDRLVHPVMLSYARRNAELIYVGKAAGEHTMRQNDINRLLISKAKDGKIVCRLKGGDPFVFGRGGEEAEALAQEGVEFEVVPGVTSAIAVPAYAGIPVTHRDYCSTLGIVTGHEKAGGESQSRIRWDKITTGLDTIVFLMGIENLPGIVSELLANGRDASTPIALIRWGTRAEQETVVGTLSDIVEKVQSTGFKAPAVTVVGEVVRLRDKLRWFDNRPLFGKKVLVTRSREQATELSELLREQGAEPIEFPVIKMSPPTNFDALDTALERVHTYDWMLFTSVNAVYAVVERLHNLGLDIRWLKGPRIGAIGPATAKAIQQFGIRVDFIPSKFVAETMVEEFPESPCGMHILIPRAEKAREVLPERLRQLGASVDVVPSYQSVIEDSDVPRIKTMLDSGDIDVITFTSSSTVRNFIELVGTDWVAENVVIACIGPVTAQTAEELGLKPHVVADEHTVKGLVSALIARAEERSLMG